jgi:5'-nucleotidase
MALTSAFLAFCSPDVNGSPEDFRLTIMHVNDTHAHLAPVELGIHFKGRQVYLDVGGFPRLASKVSKVRKTRRHSLLLHGGDVFQGTIYFSRYGGKANAEFMNLIGFDAMVVGNHEFDKDSEVLARFIDATKFPVLGANIDLSGDAILQGRVLPWVIKEFDGQKVAIIGLAPPETPFISNPNDSLFFQDPVRTARRIVTDLESKGIDKIIVLSHIGYERDVGLAKGVDGIDVIVGGHSHTLLGHFEDLGIASKGPYPTVVSTPSGGRAFVIQAWDWTKVIGVLDLVFDEKGMVTRWEGNPVIISAETFWIKDDEGGKVALRGNQEARLRKFIASSPLIETLPENRTVGKRLAFYDSGIGNLRSEVIAKVQEHLFHTWIPEKTRKKSMYAIIRGSHIAPLVAESMLWKGRSAGFDVQAVIQNAGGIRSDIPKGTLTAAQVYELLPFGNTLHLFKLTGRQIRTALETGASRGGGAFPYVAGIRYYVDMKRKKGHRIILVEIKPPDRPWHAIDEKAHYLVGTNSYLASGGDGYRVFKKTTAYRYDTGFLDAKIFIEYAKHVAVLHRPSSTNVTFVP